MSHLSTKKTLWNRRKISGLFACYVFLAKSWNVVSVLNFTIILNSLSVFPTMYFFCEIAPAPRSCSLFLTPSVKAWTKIFKQMLSIWTLLKPSIPLITQCYFKSSNNEVRKAARSPGLPITSAEDRKGSYWMVLLPMGPSYIWNSLGEPTRPSSI